MHLTVLSGEVAVCRLAPTTQWPTLTTSSPLLSISRTPKDLSVVCGAADAPGGATVEAGWTALEVAGPMEFTLVGVVSSIAAPLAAANIGIFVLSTYDTDYLLVKSDDLVPAVEALQAAGHTIS